MPTLRPGVASVPLLLALVLACSPPASRPEQVLLQMPLDSVDEVITKSGVAADTEVSRDGGGSLRVDATGPTTIRIAELEGLSVDEGRLLYRARLRSADLQGQAYLEMWCAFPGRGEFFSRALHAPLSGTNDWTVQETPFLLEKGQVPSRVKLNLVVEGPGTVWVDELVLASAGL